MRILVIDDSPMARLALRGMLEAESFTVIEADDGLEGIQTFRRDGADLVVCDLFMPVLGGMEVIEELRRDFPNVKIIAISGGGSEGNLELLPKALLAGADAILYKPFGHAALMIEVRQVLQKPAWKSASTNAVVNA
jgi:CheY-like chemotaxis protein